MPRLLISLGELIAATLTVVLALFATYRLFLPTMARLDVRGELQKGNVAVAIVVAAMMTCPTLTVLSTISPIVYQVRYQFLAADANHMSEWTLLALSVGYVSLVLALALTSVWIALRLFTALTRRLDELAELQRGNIAVGIVLSAVIVVVSAFMQVGISSVASSLIPQTPLGEIKVMR